MGRVLILFQANTEPVEQLALAVAVGAVEAEGLIRLRRLAGPDAPEVGHKSYGKLQADDLLWADVLVVGLEAAVPDSAELDPFLDLLKETALPSKRGWTFGPGGPDAPPTEAQLHVLKALRAAKVVPLPLGIRPNADDLVSRMKRCGHLSAAADRDS